MSPLSKDQAPSVENKKREGTNWRHESMSLEIGRGVYNFRTLSLLDAYEIQAHVPKLIALAAVGATPAQYVEDVSNIIAVICPMLLTVPEDLNLMSPENVKALLDFYVGHHDWSRIAALRALNNQDPGEGGEGETSQLDERTVFLLIAGRCAAQAGMSVLEFLDSRFEFCADSVIALREAMKEKDGGRMDPRQTVMMFEALLGGAEKVTDATAPDWVKELSRGTLAK